jgi:hypothetical protein
LYTLPHESSHADARRSARDSAFPIEFDDAPLEACRLRYIDPYDDSTETPKTEPATPEVAEDTRTMLGDFSFAAWDSTFVVDTQSFWPCEEPAYYGELDDIRAAPPPKRSKKAHRKCLIPGASERAKRLTVDIMRPYFRMQISLAADKLGMHVSMLKHAYRSLGLSCWPRKQLVALDIERGQRERQLLDTSDVRRRIFEAELRHIKE